MMNLQFTCPAANAALVRRLNNVEVYRYRYFGVWPNLEISSDAGAFHSAEVPLIFGNAALITGIADTPAQSELGKLMRNAWASFAKDPELALSMLGWPIYNPKGRQAVDLLIAYALTRIGNTLIELGYNDTATPIFVNSTQFDGGC
jgi:cholinesterase